MWIFINFKDASAVAPIRTLAQEPPCAIGVALKKKKKEKYRLYFLKENLKDRCTYFTPDEIPALVKSMRGAWAAVTGSLSSESHVPPAAVAPVRKPGCRLASGTVLAVCFSSL